MEIREIAISAFMGLFTVLCALAIGHPDPGVRIRSERLLRAIFGWSHD
ncbi:hypothetical protein POF50_004505 [Streptomyces sp. SL13]|uniref:Uncharacterized protein n=1 Tax=Streptantibioticus silvisoli TaxID=2705255 RepID=A0AA90GV25_9ACTN|nr:hypothetical protein [Streptantibioticus silvisoli]MDI5968613.1 hypothetical protein [Streptantibioticus silvisoli]